MEVKNHSVDVKTRKPFGLRSNYVQITFNYVQVAQILRNNYVKFQGFFELFWVLSKIFKNLGNPTKIVSKVREPNKKNWI